jgi:O-antigen/teichoic acid export membrane protein
MRPSERLGPGVGRPRAQTIGRNTLALGIGQAVTLGVNFAAWVHLSRALGPEGFGVLTLGLAILSYFLLAVTLGLDVVGVREIARAPAGDVGSLRTLVANVLGLRLALALVATALYVGIAFWVAGTAPAAVALAVLGLQLVARAVQLDWVYQGIERMWVLALRTAGAAGLLAGLAFALVRDGTDVVVAAVAVGAAPLVANGLLLGAYAGEFGPPRPRAGAWRALLVPALPLAASAFVSEVYYNLDKIMLEALRTTAEVGLYGAGYKVYALAVAPAAALFPAFFPTLARAGTQAERADAARRFASALLLIGLPVLAVAPFAAGPVLDLLFGPEYAAGAPALQLLLANAGVVYVAMAYGVPLTAWDRERAYFVVVAAGAALNVALNLLLIGRFGTAGAASATLCTEASILVGMAVLHRRETRALYAGTWLRTVPPAVTAGVVAWAVCDVWPVGAWVPAVIAAWALAAALSGGLRSFRDALRAPRP